MATKYGGELIMQTSFISPQRRMLVINPNTNPEVTARVRLAVDGSARFDSHIEVVNPLEGPFSIVTAQDRETAKEQVLDIAAKTMSDPFDAYILACFDDFAVDEVAFATGRVTIGMCEAGMLAASRIAPTFSIVTTVKSAVQGIVELTKKYEVDKVSLVRAADISIEDAAAFGQTSECLDKAIQSAIDDDHAQAILLGSGALAGYGDELSFRFGVPFVDGVSEAVKLAEQRIVLSRNY
ncbi:aspartate/glutamate racemase family protein [Thalassospira sp. CH_XMU1448-2]|uniref:aspartate/glutamate racemase family protein n=1 Tax=Thalassospira sp. CH_XMU1448-2 TaxID=3107773 RepID=UPI0030090A2C